eukprot:scaffold49768_cov55-Phaeocystis_antarctica.AAC.2
MATLLVHLLPPSDNADETWRNSKQKMLPAVLSFIPLTSFRRGPPHATPTGTPGPGLRFMLYAGLCHFTRCHMADQ